MQESEPQASLPKSTFSIDQEIIEKFVQSVIDDPAQAFENTVSPYSLSDFREDHFPDFTEAIINGAQPFLSEPETGVIRLAHAAAHYLVAEQLRALKLGGLRVTEIEIDELAEDMIRGATLEDYDKKVSAVITAFEANHSELAAAVRRLQKIISPKIDPAENQLFFVAFSQAYYLLERVALHRIDSDQRRKDWIRDLPANQEAHRRVRWPVQPHQVFIPFVAEHLTGPLERPLDRIETTLQSRMMGTAPLSMFEDSPLKDAPPPKKSQLILEGFEDLPAIPLDIRVAASVGDIVNFRPFADDDSYVVTDEDMGAKSRLDKLHAARRQGPPYTELEYLLAAEASEILTKSYNLIEPSSNPRRPSPQFKPELLPQLLRLRCRAQVADKIFEARPNPFYLQSGQFHFSNFYPAEIGPLADVGGQWGTGQSIGLPFDDEKLTQVKVSFYLDEPTE